MTATNSKRQATETLLTAVKHYREGSDSNLQTATAETNRALEIAFHVCITDKPKTREKSYFFLLADRFADQFGLPGDDLVHLKKIYRPLRNKLKEGDTPPRKEVEAFIRLAMRWLEAADVDVSEIAHILREETFAQGPTSQAEKSPTESFVPRRESKHPTSDDEAPVDHPFQGPTGREPAPSPRRRITLIDLAKELGMTSRDLIGRLADFGHTGMHVMSPISKDLANEVRGKFPPRDLPVAAPKRPRLVNGLARELGVPTDEVIDTLKTMGFEGLKGSSPLPFGTERGLRARFHKEPDRP